MIASCDSRWERGGEATGTLLGGTGCLAGGERHVDVWSSSGGSGGNGETESEVDEKGR